MSTLNMPLSKKQWILSYMQMTMIGISTLLMFACTTKKNYQSNPQESPDLRPFVLKFERGPCFGRCPVYSFFLMTDHTGLVHAKGNFLDSAGWYSSHLDQESIVEILEWIEPREWWLPNLKNQPEIADLPSSSLVYQHPTGVRTIAIQSRTSPSLEDVFAKINNLVFDGTWKPTDLRPLEPILSEKTDVIVQLKDGVDIHRWMKKYESYGIHLKKRLTPNQQYFLVARDPAKGHANDFLQFIKLDPDIIEAQWDKQVQRRY